MPTRLPERPRARAIRAEDFEAERRKHSQFRNEDTRDLHDVDSVDWLALWALSLALSAMLIAGLAYFTDHDANGAAAVLIGTAIIIAGALGASKAPSQRD